MKENNSEPPQKKEQGYIANFVNYLKADSNTFKSEVSDIKDLVTAPNFSEELRNQKRESEEGKAPRTSYTENFKNYMKADFNTFKSELQNLTELPSKAYGIMQLPKKVKDLQASVKSGDMEAFRNGMNEIGDSFGKSPEEVKEFLASPEIQAKLINQGMSQEDIDNTISCIYESEAPDQSLDKSCEIVDTGLCDDSKQQIKDSHSDVLQSFRDSCGEHIEDTCNMQLPSASFAVDTCHIAEQKAAQEQNCF